MKTLQKKNKIMKYSVFCYINWGKKEIEMWGIIFKFLVFYVILSNDQYFNKMKPNSAFLR